MRTGLDVARRRGPRAPRERHVRPVDPLLALEAAHAASPSQSRARARAARAAARARASHSTRDSGQTPSASSVRSNAPTAIGGRAARRECRRRRARPRKRPSHAAAPSRSAARPTAALHAASRATAARASPSSGHSAKNTRRRARRRRLGRQLAVIAPARAPSSRSSRAPTARAPRARVRHRRRTASRSPAERDARPRCRRRGPREPDRADRLLGRAAVGPGDAADGHGEFGAEAARARPSAIARTAASDTAPCSSSSVARARRAARSLRRSSRPRRRPRTTRELPGHVGQRLRDPTARARLGRRDTRAARRQRAAERGRERLESLDPWRRSFSVVHRRWAADGGVRRPRAPSTREYSSCARSTSAATENVLRHARAPQRRGARARRPRRAVGRRAAPTPRRRSAARAARCARARPRPPCRPPRTRRPAPAQLAASSSATPSPSRSAGCASTSRPGSSCRQVVAETRERTCVREPQRSRSRRKSRLERPAAETQHPQGRVAAQRAPAARANSHAWPLRSMSCATTPIDERIGRRRRTPRSSRARAAAVAGDSARCRRRSGSRTSRSRLDAGGARAASRSRATAQ